MATHLTPLEREEISFLLRDGHSKAEIARRLNRHRTTIFRELKRNSVVRPESLRRTYCAAAAQQQADRRRHRPRRKKMQQPDIRQYVVAGLRQFWSPDQVAGRMRLEHAQQTQMRISHQTIYRWIGQYDHGRWWRRYLRRYAPRKRRRKKKDAGPAAIANRPAIVDARQRLGDWEGDTIVGAGRSGALVSLLDRKSGYLILSKVENLQAATVRRAICRRLRPLPQSKRQTITLDNGSEFAGPEQLERRLGVGVYFADPYAPWQRGANEHANGLARQFLPKGTSFRQVSHQQVHQIENRLNQRPRKRLGYQTPQEVFQQLASDALLL